MRSRHHYGGAKILTFRQFHNAIITLSVPEGAKLHWQLRWGTMAGFAHLWIRHWLELIWIWNDMYKIYMCKKHFWRQHLCAFQVFLCVLVSWPVCTRTHAQLRGNIGHHSQGTLVIILSEHWSSFSLSSLLDSPSTKLVSKYLVSKPSYVLPTVLQTSLKCPCRNIEQHWKPKLDDIIIIISSWQWPFDDKKMIHCLSCITAVPYIISLSWKSGNRNLKCFKVKIYLWWKISALELYLITTVNQKQTQHLNSILTIKTKSFWKFQLCSFVNWTALKMR